MAREQQKISLTQGVAMMLIDLQDVFLQTVPNPQRILERCKFAAEAASLFNIPLILTTQVAGKLGPVIPDLREAAASDAKIMDKTTFSALEDKSIRQFVIEQGYEHLIIGGLETSICVYQTLISALDLDMGVTLLTDCVSCRRPDDGKAVLHFFKGSESIVPLPAETLFYSLMHDAGHPAFRNFTRLVKHYSQIS